MKTPELIEIVKEVLVEAEVFSSDVDVWLEEAAKATIKALARKGLQIRKKPGQPCQRQDSTLDQLKDLIQLANKNGMYDAASGLQEEVNKWRSR